MERSKVWEAAQKHKTDITAVRRLSAPTVKDWAWTKRPRFVQQKLMDWALQECSRPAAVSAA